MKAARSVLHAAPVQVAPAPATWILRRTGMRPLKFAGRLLDSYDDIAEPAWAHIRLAVYSCDPCGLVGEIACRPPGAPHVRPWCHAACVASLAELMGFFEAVQPAAEAAEPAPPTDDAAALLLHGVSLLRREAAQIHAVRHVIGTFLRRLCDNQAVRDLAVLV